MIIGIDNISPGASTSQSAMGGMHSFLQGLVSRLARRGARHHYLVFAPTWADDLVSDQEPNVLTIRCKGVPRGRLGRVVYEQLWLPGVLRRNEVELWLGTANVIPLAWGGMSIVLLQSLQYFTQPDSFSWTRRMYLRAIVPPSLRKADCVVAFSQASKDYIIRQLKLPESKISVIHHGMRFANRPDAGSTWEPPEGGLDGERGSPGCILFVSAFYPYKNLIRLIQAFALLKPRFRHKLVLIGSETEQVTYESVRDLAREHGVEDDVAILGHVSDSTLAAYYSHASLMVMPSLEETFGLPILEAMAFGCPVVTSDRGAMLEIGADAVVLVDPNSAESISEGMARVLSNPDLRRRLSLAGQARAKEFTAERFTSGILDLIDSLKEG